MPTGDTSKLKEGIWTKGQRDRAGSLHTPSPLNLGQRSSDRLADMIASKRLNPYPAVMGWLRCRLSFASIRSTIMW